MPFVGESLSLKAILDTVLAKTKTKPQNKLANPTGGRELPVTGIINCSRAQQNATTETFARVANSYVPVIRGWGGAGPKLADQLAQFNMANTWVSCKGCTPYSSVSYKDGGDGYPEIRVCASATPYAFEFKRFLFQELLLLAGANPFDVQIIQAYFRSWDGWNGSVPVGKWDGPIDWHQLCRDGRKLTGMYAADLAGTSWFGARGKERCMSVRP